MRLAVVIFYYQHVLNTSTPADKKEHLLGALSVDIARLQDEVYNERPLQIRIRKFLAYSKELKEPVKTVRKDAGLKVQMTVEARCVAA